MVVLYIPKAALNMFASGFSEPTSEDMITASNLQQSKHTQKKHLISAPCMLLEQTKETRYNAQFLTDATHSAPQATSSSGSQNSTQQQA